MRVENDEPIYTYKDKWMIWYVRQTVKGDKCTACNHLYKIKMAEKILETIWEALIDER